MEFDFDKKHGWHRVFPSTIDNKANSIPVGLSPFETLWIRI